MQLGAVAAPLTVMRTSAVLILLVLLVGCGDGRGAAPSEPPGGGASDELEGEWRLIRGKGPDGPVPPAAAPKVTLTIDGRTVGGTAACNQYFGTVELAGDNIRITEIGATEMGCEEPLMRAEGVYLGALARVRTFEVGDGTLTLRGPATELEFEVVVPPEPAALVGTTWRLESLLIGLGNTGAAQSVRGGRLVLRDDGTFEGRTGCRAISGRWSRDEQTLTTSEVAVEARACPEGGEQDRHVVDVLRGAMTYTIDGRSLELQQRGGELGLHYNARVPDEA